jgi:hypothetical protein
VAVADISALFLQHVTSGPKGEFNKKVLHAYIDMYSFTKMPIDLAIRYSLPILFLDL